jgi:hypothetical protein
VKAIVFGLLTCFACTASGTDRLEDQFRSPPREYRPETWFHINGNNISKEGLTRDLEAIRYAGLQGIQLFNKGGKPYPGVPQTQILSPEWWQMIRHAAQECRRLDIKLTLQNCPGWSMTGGPWVPVEQAQRELVQSVTRIERGKAFDAVVPMNKEFLGQDYDYQDVCVIAFPTPEGDDLPPHVPVKIESNNEAVPWERVFDPKQSLNLPAQGGADVARRLRDSQVGKVKGQDSYVQVRFAGPVTLRSLRLPPISHMMGGSQIPRTDVRLIIEKVEGGRRSPVAEIPLPDTCWMDRQYDVTLALPEITTQELRVTFAGEQTPSVPYLYFQSQPRLHNYEAKAGYALRTLEQEIVPRYDPDGFLKQDATTDLTDRMDTSGRLVWTPPSGKWTIVRFGHVNMRKTNGPAAKEATGWECSKLDKIALEHHLRNGMVGSLAGPGGPCGDGKLYGLLMDSWERYIPTWTIQSETMFREFRERCGYELRPFLPALMGYVVDSPVRTEKFLRDLRQTMDDLFVENFFAHFRTIAREFGAVVYTEGAAGEVLPGDALRYYGVSDVPMTEFWYPGSGTPLGLDKKPVLAATSAAHLYDKQRVAAEACTQGNFGWRETPFTVRSLIDHHFALGVNHLVFHTFSHTPQVEVYPGSSFGDTTGFPLVRNQTWWRHTPAWIDYLTRCQYMLQQGEYVADVLWYLGDELARPPYQTAPFPAGYRFDLLNAEVLHTRLSVADGRIRVKDGGEYRLILLRDSQRMLLSTAQRLQELVVAGAVILGDEPQDSPSLMDGPKDIAVLRTIANELWGEGPSGMKCVGKGKVYWGKSLDEVLHEEAIGPDVMIPAQAKIPWIHRRTANADIYFLSNQHENAVDASIGFRVTGKAPEIWDLHTGQTHPAGIWQVKEGRTHVALSFEPQGSTLVVFRQAANPSWTRLLRDGETVLDSTSGWFRKCEATSPGCMVEPASFIAWKPGQYELTDAVGRTRRIMAASRSQSIDGPWTLAFEEGWDAPTTVEIPRLISLTEHTEQAVRYYSGTTTYRKRVELVSVAGQVLLDLGQVHDMAEVWCNGRKLGTRWCPPFTFDLTEAARPGTNDLEIKVTNTWRNQLIYDLRRPKEERKTWTTNPPRNAKESPAPSGLIGSVVIYTGTVAELRQDR